MDQTSGKLYLVPTPIGNLADLSARAQRVLAEADLIAAEDTRVAAQLLAKLDLPFKDLVSYHAHNEQSRVDLILAKLAAGQTIALVSDAGMPAISDPGQIVVAAAVQAGYTVCALPGPNAALTALAASGLDSRYFHFEGFIPVKGKERASRLQALAQQAETSLIYEAPHRLAKTLDDLAAQGLGDRRLCLARELTKPYESYLYLSLAEAQDQVKRQAPRGEYVLVLEGREAYLARCPEAGQVGQKDLEDQVREKILLLRKAGLRDRSILEVLVDLCDLGKNDLYQLIKDEASSE